MEKLNIWTFKKIGDPKLVQVISDESATNLAQILTLLAPNKWGIKARTAARFQLVENWIFERSEASKVDFEAEDREIHQPPPEEASVVSSLAWPPQRPGVITPHLKIPPPPGPLPIANGAIKSRQGSGPLGVTHESLNAADAKRPERAHARVAGRLRILLIAGDRSFRSFSKNMSKGGVLLEHKIPAQFSTEACRVVIGSPDLKENLEFQGRVVNKGDQSALEFVGSKEIFMKKFESWMEHVHSTQKTA